MERLKESALIRFEIDFCRIAEIKKQNLVRIKNGEAHFTPEHIRNVCEKLNINANWIFGVESQMFRRYAVNNAVNKVNNQGANPTN